DDEVAEIISYLLLNNDSEASEIAQTIERYIQIIDEPIATEKVLNNNEIITIVQAEKNNQEQKSNDDNKELLPLPIIAKK
ncbi:21621_t:CDS:1, partial [Racocetra persica]